MSEEIMSMAWNEPGSGDKKDPWGRNNDGPPDLDQIFRKFQERLRKLFSGKNNNNKNYNNGNKSGITNNGILLSLISLAIFYLSLGFYIVHPYEQGVITRFGKYNRTVTEGPHWIPRFIEQVELINTEELISSKHSGWMLTQDENILFVEVEVQYRILNSEKYLFSSLHPDLALQQAADSALRQVIGDSLTEDVLTDKKQQIAIAIKDKLEKILHLYDIGFHIATVNFKDSRPPDEVKDAFDDVTKSREDKERLSLQADAYYNQVIPKAEGQAKQIILDAEGYRQETILKAQGAVERFNLILPEYKLAPEVTKSRLYLDTIERVLANSSKVLLDAGNGNNNLIYLPLDQLINKSKSLSRTRAIDMKNENIDSLQDNPKINDVRTNANSSSSFGRRRG